jgi:hypothetical protein
MTATRDGRDGRDASPVSGNLDLRRHASQRPRLAGDLGSMLGHRDFQGHGLAALARGRTYLPAGTRSARRWLRPESTEQPGISARFCESAAPPGAATPVELLRRPPNTAARANWRNNQDPSNTVRLACCTGGRLRVRCLVRRAMWSPTLSVAHTYVVGNGRFGLHQLPFRLSAGSVSLLDVFGEASKVVAKKQRLQAGDWRSAQPGTEPSCFTKNSLGLLGIIASLLITLWTGKKPSKRTWEMIQFYFGGWATEAELSAHLQGLSEAKRSAREPRHDRGSRFCRSRPPRRAAVAGRRPRSGHRRARRSGRGGRRLHKRRH